MIVVNKDAKNNFINKWYERGWYKYRFGSRNDTCHILLIPSFLWLIKWIIIWNEI